jgi:hypothetical protein
MSCLLGKTTGEPDGFWSSNRGGGVGSDRSVVKGAKERKNSVAGCEYVCVCG